MSFQLSYDSQLQRRTDFSLVRVQPDKGEGELSTYANVEEVHVYIL